MPRPPAPPVKPVSTGPSGVLIGTVVVLVIALIAGLVWAVTRDGADLSAAGSSNALAEGGGISNGPGLDADVPQLHVYGDFQCPWCGVLEEAIGEQVEQKVAADEVHLTTTLMSFLVILLVAGGVITGVVLAIRNEWQGLVESALEGWQQLQDLV